MRRHKDIKEQKRSPARRHDAVSGGGRDAVTAAERVRLRTVGSADRAWRRSGTRRMPARRRRSVGTTLEAARAKTSHELGPLDN